MITPINKLPESKEDARMLKAEKLKNDITEIIEEQYRYCEVTSDYAVSTMRNALKAAIRRAMYAWNHTHDMMVDYDDLVIHRRKASDGKVHWFIENKRGLGDA